MPRKLLEYTPSVLTWVMLFVLIGVTAPWTVSTVLVILLGPMPLESPGFEHKGDIVLGLWPSTLIHSTFVGDWPYWRPGLLAVFVLVGVGATVGYFVKKEFQDRFCAA